MNTRREAITAYSKTTLALMAAAFFMVVLYVYFLNVSVVEVVMQKEASRHVQELKNEIAVLESDYIMAQHTIAARMATMEGVVAERNKVFVSRDAGVDLVARQ